MGTVAIVNIKEAEMHRGLSWPVTQQFTVCEKSVKTGNSCVNIAYKWHLSSERRADLILPRASKNQIKPGEAGAACWVRRAKNEQTPLVQSQHGRTDSSSAK